MRARKGLGYRLATAQARATVPRLARLVLLLAALLPAGCVAGAPVPSVPPTSPVASPRPSPERAAADTGSRFHRLLIEAEDLTVESGWQAIDDGAGNYMVDSIGAAHVSGGRLLHAAAALDSARAVTDLVVPAAGRYKLWARYEYPYPAYAVPFEVRLEQGGRTVFDQVYGRRDATRMWFFGRRDAPWQDFENGVEGPVAEAAVADLAAGPARLTLATATDAGPLADRNVDFLFLTDDLDDTFRARGVRAYPLLDEVGWAAAGRAYLRLTNPPDGGVAESFDASYAINRQPWSVQLGQIDRSGLISKQAPASPLAPGERTPWIDISCQDTTHDCHLNLRANTGGGARRIAVGVEVASAPREDAILRRFEYREPAADRLLLNLPPYPAREPDGILTGEEAIDRILVALAEGPAPSGRPPARFLVYGALGDGFEANLTSRAGLYERYRRLLAALGPSAVAVQKSSNARAAADLVRATGRDPPPAFRYGGYRWYPSDENLAEAARDLDAAGARPLLRGFNFGDEVKLADWLPRQGRDETFRAWLQARGADPRDYLTAPPAAGETPAALWARVALQDAPGRAAQNPRLYVDSQRFLEQLAIDGLAAQAARLRALFGDSLLFGATFSPHPYFWPPVAQWVRLFRAGGATLGAEDDYWWQASELGPQSTGYLLDVLRAGVGRSTPPGALQPYVLPHSPGNTDRDFRLGLASALIHGAGALDLFNLGPEQTGTENYIARRDLARYRTVRDALSQLGPVEDLLVAGRARPARVGLILSDSTDRWELAAAGLFPLLGPEAKVPSLVYAQERKLTWTALRHAQVPVDVLLEDDLAADAAGGYAVLYLAGDHLTPEAAAGLARWVAAGGTLVCTLCADPRDPYDTPLEALLPVLGLRRSGLERRETFFRPRVELPRLRPLDTVTATADGQALTFPALGVRQPLDPLSEARVLGRFADGGAAVVEHAYGRGRAVTFGTLPATAYVQSGFPSPPPVPDRGPGQHTPLTAFRADLRRLLTGWTDAIRPDWPVSSDPLVEVGQRETADQVLYILANGRGAPSRVELRLNAVGPLASVTSSVRGPLPFEQRGEDAVVRLDLGDVDYLRVARPGR